MSRLSKLDSVKGQDDYLCRKVASECLNDDELICHLLDNIPCAYCPVGVSLQGQNNYLYLTNTQLETNHERTDQAANQTGTTPHCE